MGAEGESERGFLPCLILLFRAVRMLLGVALLLLVRQCSAQCTCTPQPAAIACGSGCASCLQQTQSCTCQTACVASPYCYSGYSLVSTTTCGTTTHLKTCGCIFVLMFGAHFRCRYSGAVSAGCDSCLAGYYGISCSNYCPVCLLLFVF